jgi:hypothetical protein
MADFILHLRSLPHEVPVWIRMRRLLKLLLRSLGFRCIGIEQIGIAQASEVAEPMVASSAGPSAKKIADSGSSTGNICTQTQLNFRRLIDTPSESAGK